MPKQLIFSDDARKKILDGVNKLADVKLSSMFLMCSSLFLIVLLICNETFAQMGQGNPFQKPIGLHATVLFSTTNGTVARDVEFNSPLCSHYHASMPGTWNGKFTDTGVRLSNIDTSNLSFPLLAPHHFNGQDYLLSITAADIDRFWENHIFSAANGYTKISGASLAMNCHGYSTGLGYWVNDFDFLMSGNYYYYFFANDGLEAGTLFGGPSHSIKIAEVTTNGINQCTVVTTRQKYAESGVYEKIINQTFFGHDLVELALTIVNTISGNYDVVSKGFYKKK